MLNRPYPPANPWPITNAASESPGHPFKANPPSLPTLSEDFADSRQVKLAIDEPKRRLIRDARAICKLRGITQGQMAEELGISKRTLEEWLQFRRMPQAPAEALLRRWVHDVTSQALSGNTTLT